jgi:hypothetical protein
MRTTRILVTLAIAASGAWTPAFSSDDQTRQPRAPAPGRDWPSQGYIAVDGGYQVHSLSFSETHRELIFLEDAVWTADYRVADGIRYEVGGGLRLWRNLLAAGSFSFFKDTNPAAISARIPHPFRFNDPRSLEAEASSLSQDERVVHVSAAWMTPVTRRLELGVFGGPSIFLVKRSLVEDVIYSDVFPFDTVTFTRAAVRDVSSTQIGIHAGADVTYLFTRRFGVGGTARFTTATVDLATPSGGSLSLKVGGFQAGAGIRLRLGDRVPRGAARTPGRTPPGSPAPLPAPPGTDVLRTAPTAAITTATTPVYISPAVGRTPLKELPANTRVRVLGQKGDWTQIEFDDSKWGRRVGWVESKRLRIEKQGGRD